MKSCILFSGGWDSIAVALKIRGIDLLFFNYGQTYYENELAACVKFSTPLSANLIVRDLVLEHDIERRNFYFLMEAKRLGYDCVYTGNRNIAPIFDKYKDSNFISIHLFAHLCNIKVKMPIMGWGKRRIVKFILKDNPYHTPYNCYHNNDNYKTCKCPNCVELQGIL